MLGFIVRLSAACGVAIIAFAATVTASQAAPQPSTHATLGPETSIPYGWVDFCERHGADCVEEARTVRRHSNLAKLECHF